MRRLRLGSSLDDSLRDLEVSGAERRLRSRMVKGGDPAYGGPVSNADLTTVLEALDNLRSKVKVLRAALTAVNYVAKKFEFALEPFVRMGRHPTIVKGKPDACWCGQAPEVLRYRDFHAAVAAVDEPTAGLPAPIEES